MIKELQSLSLLDILPANLLADKKVAAAAQALDAELQAVTRATVETMHLPRLEVLPEAVIDLLAWQWHVDFYEPIGMDIETKRKLVKESIAWHRIKGTPAAVEKVVTAAFDSASVMEWFEYEEGAGEPYHFRLTTTDTMHGSDSYKEMIRAIESVKNVRSVLDGIIFKFTMQDTVKKPIDETPEFYPTFDMVDNFPVARRLYGTGVTYGNGIYYGGAVDRMELAVCLDIKEDNYTVAQKAYGAGRTYGDGGEPYGGTAGPADAGGRLTASISINYGDGMSYGASTQFYGTGLKYDGSIKYGNKARVYGGWRLEEDIN